MTTKAILLTLLTLFAAGYLVFWIRQDKLMQKSGHLPWRRPITALLAWRALTPLMARSAHAISL